MQQARLENSVGKEDTSQYEQLPIFQQYTTAYTSTLRDTSLFCLGHFQTRETALIYIIPVNSFRVNGNI